MKELVTGPRVSQPSVPVPDGDQAVGGGRIDALLKRFGGALEGLLEIRFCPRMRAPPHARLMP
ncbi:MAG: hypothetical protein JO170_28865 [Verrucomicrobia bacterium]|nr:hypothetical protein [Verrucomicrobiota bacterium]